MDDKKKKILIIEDDVYLRKALVIGLEDRDFVVVQAANGKQGLEVAQTEKPDLIILDLIMPEKDGFEFLEDRKLEYKELLKIPVIVLTNLGQEEDKKRALDLGAEDYFLKVNMSIKAFAERIKFNLAKYT